MIASVVSMFKWVSLVFIVMGEKVKIWDMIGMPPPSVYTWTQNNKIVACMGVFFVSNGIENALIQTGAFEVELNGMPIWSKLKSGRVPSGNEIFEIIENQLKLSPNEFKGEFKPPNNFQGVHLPVESPDQKTNTDEDKDNTNESKEEVEEEPEQSEEKVEDVKPKYVDEFSEIDRETQDTDEDKQEDIVF